MATPMSFGLWTKWDARMQMNGRDMAGVYLLGRFEDKLPETVDPLDSRVIAIIETHNQTFVQRWGQFEQCAFDCKTGHSPGITFNEKYMYGKPGTVPPWLYVSALAMSEPAETGKAELISGVKRDLLEQYRERHGRLPSCVKRIS